MRKTGRLYEGALHAEDFRQWEIIYVTTTTVPGDEVHIYLCP